MTRKIFSMLSSLYKSHPALYSLIELSLFLGLFFLNLWIAPFWFWGIYRLNIHVPDIIERIFFSLWHLSPQLVVPSAILGLFALAVTLSVRKDSLRELGIRLDNLKASGRECLITFLIGGSLILIVFLFFYLEDFSSSRLIKNLGFVLMYPLWGTIQQFFLQSVIFIRLLQILKNKNITIFVSAVIFSLLHAPQIFFMGITFIAGLCCCILFLRHRNIFTLGILHGVLAGMVYVLFVPGVVDNFSAGPVPGTWKNNTEFIAYIRYDGSTIVAKPPAIITIPLGIENKSTARWDSNEKQHPVYVSYHLMDAEGNMIVFDNIRTSFPHPIGPGESLKVNLIVTVPPDLGRYQLEIDIVKEWLSWFKDRGSLTVQIPLVVSNAESQPSRTLFKKEKGDQQVF